MGQYLPVLAMVVLAIVFGALSRLASRLLAPSRSTVAKSAPYECGIVPQSEGPERFPVRFYLIAMSFIVFDIEIIFLYPWAVTYRDLGVYGLLVVTAFAVPVLLSLVYEIANGAFDWGPAKRTNHGPMVSAERTSSATVRRVGSEGRDLQAAPARDPSRDEALV
jgi:NADH-quinone oxidoreductase subunit A